MVEPPSLGWGGESPYEGGRFIASCITQISEQLTDEGRASLEYILEGNFLGNHVDHARHVLAEHIRAKAEIAWQQHSLEGIRRVLLSDTPVSIDDLQSVVMDELHNLQSRLRDGTYNGALPFWNTDKPQHENYCRDRIAEHIEPRLKPFGIRIHTEGTMPEDKRCDLLCTVGEIDLPLEIKGQWHENIWSAACDQLEDNYSRNYRAEGRGVYLVLWFDDVPNYNPPNCKKLGMPKNGQDMLAALSKNSTRTISPLTKLFVLDLSKPSKTE